MSIRQRVTDKAPGFEGQKSALPLESYGISAAQAVSNFFLHHKQLNKSPGCTLWGEVVSDTGGVSSLHQFKDIMFIQRGLNLSLSVIPDMWYQLYPTLPKVTDFPSSITSRLRLQSTFYREKLFLTNTQDCIFIPYNNPFLYQGPRPLGLDGPSTGLDSSWFGNVSAGNVENENHYYMVALYDANTNTESPCGGAMPTADGLFELSPNGFLGPVAALYNPGAASKIYINGSSLKSLLTAATGYTSGRATHFIIYRSGPKDGNGLYTSFFRVPLKDGGTYDGQILIPISALTGTSTGGAVPPIGVVNDFVDNSASLPAVSPPENNSPPPTPVRMKAALTAAGTRLTIPPVENWALTDYSGFRHVRFFRDQLFGVGARSYGMTVSQDIKLSSDTSQTIQGKVTDFQDLLHGSEVYQPDYWPYRWEVGKGDGQETVGLGILGDVALLVFKETSAYYLAGASPDNFVVRIMDTRRGCCNEGTIQETPLGVITLDRSGFVLWNKIGQGQPISDDVHDVIEQIQFLYAPTFYSCYDSKLKIYRCSVVVAGSQQPNLTFVLDLDSMQWTFEQGNEGGARLQFSIGTNNNTGIQAAAAGISSSIDAGKVYDFLGAKTTGKVFDYSQPDTNVLDQYGNAIAAVWQSGAITFGDDQHKKRMNWVYVRAKSNGGWKIDLEVIPDYDESRKYTVSDWDVTASQSEWYSSDIATDGSLFWDSGDGSNDGGTWASAGQQLQIAKIPVKCIARTFQIRIIQKDSRSANSQFAIESVSAEGVMLGR